MSLFSSTNTHDPSRRSFPPALHQVNDSLVCHLPATSRLYSKTCRPARLLQRPTVAMLPGRKYLVLVSTKRHTACFCAMLLTQSFAVVRLAPARLLPPVRPRPSGAPTCRKAQALAGLAVLASQTTRTCSDSFARTPLMTERYTGGFSLLPLLSSSMPTAPSSPVQERPRKFGNSTARSIEKHSHGSPALDIKSSQSILLVLLLDYLFAYPATATPFWQGHSLLVTSSTPHSHHFRGHGLG